TTSTTFNVTVSAVAEKPTLVAFDSTNGRAAASNTIGLSISDSQHDADDTLSSVTISGVPSGWSLSGDGAASIGPNTWTAAAGDLAALALVAPAGTEDTVVALAVTASATEAGAVGSATTSTTFNVTVSAVAEKPTLVAFDS